VISKSKDHLAPPFLQFCKKYDICNLNGFLGPALLARYLKFEDITFYNLSVYHYNFHDKQKLYNNCLKRR